MTDAIKKTQFFRILLKNDYLTLNEKRILLQLNSRTAPITQKYLLDNNSSYTKAALSRTISSLLNKGLIECAVTNGHKEYIVAGSLYCKYPSSISNTIYYVAGSPLIRNISIFDTFIAASYLMYSPQKYSARDLLQLLPHYNENMLTNACALLICLGIIEATMSPSSTFASLSVNNSWNGINHIPLF